MGSFWHTLESLAGGCQAHSRLAAVPVTWRRLAGVHYEGMFQAFLRQTEREARSYPCPELCGCFHEVVRHASGRMVAVCACDPPECASIPVTSADLRLVELNWAKLGRALAGAMEFEPLEVELGIAGTRQVGAFGRAGLPVVLSIQMDRAGLASAVAQLGLRLKGRFVLLAPSRRFYDAGLEMLLQAAGAGFFDLESIVAVSPAGRLIAAQRAGELFAQFLPEQTSGVKESESKLVFRLFGELLAKGAGLKASPAQVFDLMVLKKLSHGEAAAECGCVPSLITRRVATIERHFGMSMEKLQGFASDLKERRTTVKGDVYVKKKQGSPQVDAPESEDGEDEDAPPPEEYRYE